MARKTIGVGEAAKYLNMAATTLCNRIERGTGPRLRSRDPIRISVADLVTYARTAPPVRPALGGPRRTVPLALDVYDDRLARLLATTKGN